MYILNQEISADAPHVNLENPAFLYGESVFTSFFIKNGKMLSRQAHIERLNSSSSKMFAPTCLPENMIEQHFKLIAVNFSKGDFRVRMSIFRSSLRNELILFTSIKAIDLPFFGLTENSELVGLLEMYGHCSEELGQVKVSSYAKEFRSKFLLGHDFIKFNAQGFVSELSTSNLILCRDQSFFTPQVRENYLKGITHGVFNQFLKDKLGSKLEYKEIHYSELKNYDFLLKLNSVSLLKRVLIKDAENEQKDLSYFEEIYDKFKKYVHIKLEDIHV